MRLRYAYFITCQEVVKDPATGKVVELRCTYDPATRGGDAPDGRKVKATLHWVSAEHAVAAEVRLYDHLFTKEFPDEVEEGQDFTANLNPNSLETLTATAYLEPSLAAAQRRATASSSSGWAILSPTPIHAPPKPVFNRTVTLRDTWAKIEKAMQQG